MSKRDLAITAAAAVLVIIIIVLLIRALTNQPSPSSRGAGESQSSAATVVGTRPTPVSPGLQVWGGILTLTEGEARLAALNRSYNLFIKAPGQSSKILKEQGYRSGDQVSVIGKISGDYLEVSGVSK